MTNQCHFLATTPASCTVIALYVAILPKGLMLSGEFLPSFTTGLKELDDTSPQLVAASCTKTANCECKITASAADGHALPEAWVNMGHC